MHSWYGPNTFLEHSWRIPNRFLLHLYRFVYIYIYIYSFLHFFWEFLMHHGHLPNTCRYTHVPLHTFLHHLYYIRNTILRHSCYILTDSYTFAKDFKDVLISVDFKFYYVSISYKVDNRPKTSRLVFDMFINCKICLVVSGETKI